MEKDLKETVVIHKKQYLYYSIFACFCGFLIVYLRTKGTICDHDMTKTKYLVEGNPFGNNNKPRLVCVEDFKIHAWDIWTDSQRITFEEGATTQHTLKDNMKAFERYRLLPRVLVGVAGMNDTGTTILGQQVSMPIGISPIAYQLWAHPDGDSGTARAAEHLNIISIHSAYSTSSIEDIAEASPGGIKWQQIYLFGLREYTLDFLHRAENAGYTGIVVTVDRAVTGLRWNPMRGLVETPANITNPNFKNNSFDLQWKLYNPGQTWEELRWLRNRTNLPIIVKGILTPEDAKLAKEHGADAIMVSNHGGRVLDGVPATIDALSDIIKAVNGSLEVYLDGGIRTGMDTFKAVALGARAVFVGRAMVYGLSHSGQKGVEQVLEILQKEFSNTAALCGANSVNNIKPSMVQKPFTSLASHRNDEL